MNATEPTAEKEKFRELNPFSGISSSPSLVIIKKTLIFDLLTRGKLLISIIFMIINSK